MIDAIKRIYRALTKTFEINIQGPAGAIEHGFMIAGVKKEEVDKCFDWCFGRDARTMQMSCLDNEWNKRHSDIFIMDGTDIIWTACMKAGKAYLDKNK